MTLAEAVRTKGDTDWALLDAMTDEEVTARALADPDAQPSTPEQLARMRRVVNPTAIREATGLTQEAFARRFGLPVGTVRDWEQGRTRPDRAAENYLRVIAADPEVARRAVGGE